MKKLLVLGLLFITNMALAQTKDMWNEFAKTKFDPKYNEKLGEYLFYPTFTPELKNTVGKEVTLQGFYVPFAAEGQSYIVISKYPMSQCFFCGGAGPESIAEVTFVKSNQKFEVDDLITVKGKLKLNTEDMEHVNFILTDAVLVSK